MENMNVHRSIVINGDLKFTNVSRVLQSKTFGKMITTFVNELEIRHSRKLKAVIPFVMKTNPLIWKNSGIL